MQARLTQGFVLRSHSVPAWVSCLFATLGYVGFTQCLRRPPWSLSEEITFVHQHAVLGNAWARLAAHLPQRDSSEVKVRPTASFPETAAPVNRLSNDVYQWTAKHVSMYVFLTA